MANLAGYDTASFLGAWRALRRETAQLPGWARRTARKELIDVYRASREAFDGPDVTLAKLRGWWARRRLTPWGSLPPALQRGPGEDVDGWLDRCYAAWACR